MGLSSCTRFAALVALALAAAGRARADYVLTEVDEYPFSGGPSITIPIKEFDPALGQLYSVSITVSVYQYAYGSASFENTSDQPVDYRVAYISWFNLSAPGVRLGRLSPSTFWGGSGVVGAFDGLIDSAGPDFVKFTESLPAVGTGFVIYPPDANAYIGKVYTSATVSVETNTRIFNINFDVLQTARITGTLGVGYTYIASAIPEPSTAALLGLGALASLSWAGCRGRVARRPGAGAAPPGARAPRPPRGSAPS